MPRNRCAVPRPSSIGKSRAWTRFPLPGGVRRLRNAVLYVLLAFQVLALSCPATQVTTVIPPSIP